MRKKWASVMCLLLCVCLLLCSNAEALAVTIQELQQDILKRQAELNNVNGNISSLEDEQDVIEEEIQDIDSELINLYTEIGVLEDRIAEEENLITEKEGEIVVAQGEYEQAQAVEEEQYAAMKKRIKYMYETGNESYFNLLLSSNGFSDMLNKAQYIENLYEYDRNMLLKFQRIKEEVAEMKAALEDDKVQLENEMAALEQDKSQLAEQQSYLNGILAQKKAESANYEAQIQKAKSQAAAYKKQIEADNKKIKQLQEEERKRLAAKNGTGSYTVKASAAATVAQAQAVVAASSGSATGKSLASYACQFIGNPYVPGGTSLTNGADCSGFIFRVYADFGRSVPRTSYALRSAGTGVSLAEAQPGDVVCYEGHVGLYIGGGLIVHASTQKTGIKISNAQYRSILAVRRLL